MAVFKASGFQDESSASHFCPTQLDDTKQSMQAEEELIPVLETKKFFYICNKKLLGGKGIATRSKDATRY